MMACGRIPFICLAISSLAFSKIATVCISAFVSALHIFDSSQSKSAYNKNIWIKKTQLKTIRPNITAHTKPSIMPV
jgi:hypothetical protein